MRKAIFAKLKESLASVLPVTLIVLLAALSPFFRLSPREAVVFVCSALAMIAGIALFNLGADLAMTPMGEQTGVSLTRTKKLIILLPACFVMGVLITIAEPDLFVLANQVSAVMNGTLLIACVGVGVGLFLVLGVVKIVFREDLPSRLLFYYMVLFGLAAIMIERGSKPLLSLAFDSGGVTTGPVTVPFLMALGVGIAQTIGGKRAEENSFGLIALCSVGPILAVLLLGCGASGDLVYEMADYSMPQHMGPALLEIAAHSAKSVLKALALISGSFLILNFTLLKLPAIKIKQIGVGILYAFAGLVVFLTAVEAGFMPVGFSLGASLAGGSGIFFVLFCAALGGVTVLAEPAVHVLNKQVEELTRGNVTRREMMVALSLGVGLSIGLSAVRILCGFSLLYYLIPGYLLSLGLSLYVPKLYTAIAFDSGGVASGPLTSSFILPLMIGACSAMRGASYVMDFAFGVVAMVAMTPLIMIQSLSFRAIAVAKIREKVAIRRMLEAGDEQIIYFDWEDQSHAR